MIIIIRNLDTEKAYLASSVKNGKDKTDKSGIEEAMKLKDTITIGRTIYEYSRALEHFVEKQGRLWKSVLREAWTTGSLHENAPKRLLSLLEKAIIAGAELLWVKRVGVHYGCE